MLLPAKQCYYQPNNVITSQTMLLPAKQCLGGNNIAYAGIVQLMHFPIPNSTKVVLPFSKIAQRIYFPIPELYG